MKFEIEQIGIVPPPTTRKKEVPSQRNILAEYSQGDRVFFQRRINFISTAIEKKMTRKQVGIVLFMILKSLIFVVPLRCFW